MLKKKLLVIAPYPIARPQHGGQKRTKALYEFYKTIFAEVKFIGVYHRGFYEERGEEDLLLGDIGLIKKIDASPYASELLTGQAIDQDIHVRSYLAEVLTGYAPDVIHVEQVFPYAGLRVLLPELNLKPLLIFGSQNVEYLMKEKIYAEVGLSADISRSIIDQTRSLETQFSSEADLVIAVSAEDAKEHKKMGAKHVVVAPNGIEKSFATKQSITYWQEFKKANSFKKAITFIGSGHPPNWVGFVEMLGMDSTFLPPGSRIILAGGIAEYFRATYKHHNPGKRYAKFWANIIPVGFLSEDKLSGLLHESEVLLLPITSGGGSNLKTAEAILSGNKIMATPYAFRGFEAYAQLPNIYIEAAPTNFRKTLLKVLDTPKADRTKQQAVLAEGVQWKYCLQPIKKGLNKVLLTKWAKRTLGVPKKAAGKIKRRLRK